MNGAAMMEGEGHWCGSRKVIEVRRWGVAQIAIANLCSAREIDSL